MNHYLTRILPFQLDVEGHLKFRKSPKQPAELEKSVLAACKWKYIPTGPRGFCALCLFSVALMNICVFTCLFHWFSPKCRKKRFLKSGCRKKYQMGHGSRRNTSILVCICMHLQLNVVPPVSVKGLPENKRPSAASAGGRWDTMQLIHPHHISPPMMLREE